MAWTSSLYRRLPPAACQASQEISACDSELFFSLFIFQNDPFECRIFCCILKTLKRVVLFWIQMRDLLSSVAQFRALLALLLSRFPISQESCDGMVFCRKKKTCFLDDFSLWLYPQTTCRMKRQLKSRSGLSL